jgi:hypothetical protein
VSPLRTARSYWIFCALLLPLVIFSAFDRSWNQDADIWETAAAIRAASHNLVQPSNPLLPLPGDTSPRFTPFVLLWGWAMRVTGLQLFTIVGLAGIANYILFVTGLAHWLTRQTREPKFALLAFIIMLTVWGTGYIYANAYQIGFFLASLAYVGTFAYGLCFHALAYLDKYLTGRSRGSIIAYTLLSVLGFLSHPITTAFQFVAAVAILLPDKNWKRLIWMQVVPLVCLGAALLWPYFNYWTVLFKGSTENWFPAALFKGQILRVGTALAGIPIAAYFAVRRRHMWVVWGVFICTAIYALSGAVRFLMGSRFLLYGAIFLHVAIALYLFENWPNWLKHLSLSEPRRFLKPVIVLLLILPALPSRFLEVRNVVWSFTHAAFDVEKPNTPADQLSFLANYLSRTDVVLAEDHTGWPVPALTGARLVSQQKGDPLIQPEILRRREDATQFFQGNLSMEDRRALLKRYHVTHILLDMGLKDRWSNFLLPQITQLATEQASQNPIVLYRVLP